MQIGWGERCWFNDCSTGAAAGGSLGPSGCAAHCGGLGARQRGGQHVRADRARAGQVGRARGCACAFSSRGQVGPQHMSSLGMLQHAGSILHYELRAPPSPPSPVFPVPLCPCSTPVYMSPELINSKNGKVRAVHTSLPLPRRCRALLCTHHRPCPAAGGSGGSHSRWTTPACTGHLAAVPPTVRPFFPPAADWLRRAQRGCVGQRHPAAGHAAGLLPL